MTKPPYWNMIYTNWRLTAGHLSGKGTEELVMIHIAVVENEDTWADTITGYLKKYEEEYQEQFDIRRYRDGYEIADGYAGGLDIILMDIKMGLMDGMEAAEQIRLVDEQVVIIFITNMAQYALRGYKVNALDYILKPIVYMPFSQTLKKAIRSLGRTKEDYITVNTRTGIRKLRTSDIFWIESSGHRLTFYTEDASYETTVYSMKEMEERLAPEGFSRCNSGSLVNLRRVDGVDGGYIRVGKNSLPISRSRKKDFLAAFVSYMTG